MPYAHTLTFYVLYLNTLPYFILHYPAAQLLYMYLAYQITDDITKMIDIIRKRFNCHCIEFKAEMVIFHVSLRFQN